MAAGGVSADEPPAAAAPRRAVVVVTVGATFLAFLDTTIVNIAFPAIEADFAGVGRPTLSWILNAYNVVFAALLLPAGRLGDRLGHRRLFCGGLLAFTAASALCAAAPGPELLIATRIAQAAGAAILMPTALALLLAAYPPRRRASAVAAAGAAAGVAAALGPALGGMLVDGGDWRLIFLVNVPLGIALWLAGRRVLPAPQRRPQPLPDVWGTVLLATGVGLVGLGLVQGPEWGWQDPRVLAGIALGSLLLPVCVRRASRHPAPALELGLLRVRAVAVANAATVIFGAAIFAKLLCDVLFLTNVWGLTILEAGLAMSPSPLATALTAGIAARLADRYGQRVVAVAGALAYATGSAAYALTLPAEPAFVTHFLPVAVLGGIGIAAALPTLTAAAITSLPESRYGAAGGANATARQLGGVLGVAVLIAIVGDATGPGAVGEFHAGWAFIALAAVLAAVAAAKLPTASSPRRLPAHRARLRRTASRRRRAG